MEKATGRRIGQRSARKKQPLGEREKRRLAQLGACVLLFLTVFFAKGVDKLAPMREELLSALRSDVDFQAAVADLGWSMASGRPVVETMGELWTDVFLAKSEPLKRDAGNASSTKTLEVFAPMNLLAVTETVSAKPMAQSGHRPVAALSEEEKPQEPAVVHVDYTGPALPDNTTMDRYALGLSETVSPVMAVESSGFGWRTHPLENEEKFHYGVDLVSDTGTTVKAFAAGTVDYIGESDIYGQYLQLDHGNGVKSFYAHCSKLCVQQGQTVAVGEKVAESGATGEVTGPHLHFELKKDGVRLNPEYYIETQA